MKNVWTKDPLSRRRATAAALIGLVCVVATAGCGGADPPREPAVRWSGARAGVERPPASEPESPADVEDASGEKGTVASDVEVAPSPRTASEKVPREDPPGVPDRRPLAPAPADAMRDVPDAAAAWVPNLASVQVDEDRARAAGIRKVSGRRLTLYTDVAVDDEIKALPAAFEQAFPQWCEYFGVEESDHADWRMTGFLMKDKSRFEALGLLPEELPPFLHGFSRNNDFWLYEQPSAYYRRHLALHEGTHGFMNTVLGSCGPPWYMEGVAELLSTHRWHDGRLELNYLPRSRDEVPMWGRIKIVREDCAAGRAQHLERVLRYRPREYLATEPYAWCWAAATLLDRHPRYRERFRKLPEWVLEPDFTDRFRRAVARDWNDLTDEWQVFVSSLEYGHDVPATAIEFAPGKPLSDRGARSVVDAARGWQSAGVRLEAGRAYRLRAEGRYQVADQPQIWWCEPGGVSIRYYQGRPLGMLLAAVRVDRAAGEDRVSNLTRPVAVGLQTTLTPEQPGTLYLRINDSPAELADNAGELTVEITRLPGAD